MELGEDEGTSEINTVGTYEVAYGKEILEHGDLHTDALALVCLKNPGHKGFIPIKDFTNEHLNLPPIAGSEIVFKMITALADLVVRIYAPNLSTQRPKALKSMSPRSGSGWVRGICLCGPQTNGVQVIADLIEEQLQQYDLADLGLTPNEHEGTSMHFSEFNDLLDLRDLTDFIVKQWVYYNINSSPGELPSNNFTRDLLQWIVNCRDSNQQTNHDQKENSEKGNSDSCFTLNDYRKSKRLGVTEFCLLMIEGLKDEEDIQRLSKLFKHHLEGPCPCRRCRESGNPKTFWWRLEVVTAAHILFDDQEANGAQISLFYDDADTPPVFTPVLYMGLLRESSQNWHENDINSIICALHDDELGERLTSQIKQINCLEDAFADKCYLRFLSSGIELPVVAISHPHGCTKQISVGKEVSQTGRILTYTTPTCPGSSGGIVIGGSLKLSYIYPHCKSLNSKLNKSATFVPYMDYRYRW